jgi:hypothetical protein
MAKRKRQAGRQHAACRAQLKKVSRNLENAISQADNRGYTGMLHSRGGFVDDPRVKTIMRKYNALLKKC